MRRIFFILAPVLVLLLLASACAPKLPPEEPWEKDARSLLERAETLFAKKQYDQAEKTVNVFFSAYPKSRQADRALFLEGELRFVTRDYARALSYYKELIEKHPSSPLIYEARYKLGLCYYETGERDLAIANLEDRSRIADPAKLRRAAEVLSSAYLAKRYYSQAVRELVSLADTATTEQQRAGYRGRVREIIEKDFTEDELKALAAGKNYPADVALLRVIATLIEQRKYRAAADAAKDFLAKFPSHPERTRAEMLLSDATAKLSSPRYLIGALVPRTGQLAFFGDRVLKGIQLAVHAYNLQEPDNRVEVIVKDTEGQSDKAVAGLAELAAQGIIAAVGPVTTRDEEAILPALDKLRVPVIRPAASRSGFSGKNSWLFRNALTIDSQALAAAQYAIDRKLRKFVILCPDEPYGKDLVRLFTKDLERKAEILASVAYDPETKDFGPVIRKVIEIDLRAQKVPIPEDDQERKRLFELYEPGFDALYLPGYAERVGLLLPQLAFYNITGRTIIGSDNWHSQDLIERAGRYAEGAVFTDGFFPESIDAGISAMVAAYRSAYQEEPDILAAQAYDAANMVLSLIRGRKDTPGAIRDGLLGLKDFPGVSGQTSFNGNYEAQKRLFFITVEGGRFVQAPQQ